MLFDDQPRAIEAAAEYFYRHALSIARGMQQPPGDRYVADLHAEAVRGLTAAVAALDRREQIEAMMEAVAAEFTACSDVTAERILVRIGLIPEHVAPEEER